MKLAECILFDFDGTVYDTVEGITRSVRYAINKHGLDAELEDLRCFAGPPLDDMFMEKFGFTREEAVLATMEFRERYKPVGVYESTPFPGIRDLLEHLRASGKVVGIATSKPQELAELLLERSGMTELFDVVSGSNVGAGNNAKWEVLAAAPKRRPSSSETRSTTWREQKRSAFPASACAGAMPPPESLKPRERTLSQRTLKSSKIC